MENKNSTSSCAITDTKLSCIP